MRPANKQRKSKRSLPTDIFLRTKFDVSLITCFNNNEGFTRQSREKKMNKGQFLKKSMIAAAVTIGMASATFALAGGHGQQIVDNGFLWWRIA